MAKSRDMAAAASGEKLEQQHAKITDTCEYQLFKAKRSKSEVARYLGVSPAAVCCQFTRKSITTPVLMAVVTLTDMDAESVKQMLTVD